MVRAALCLVLSLLAAFPAAAQSVELYDGAVSVQLPPGFRRMTGDEVSQKFPRAQPPQYAYTDGDRFTQTIAVNRRNLGSGRLATLSELGAETHQRLALQSGVSVHRHELITIGGRAWYMIEYRSMAIDQPVENLMRLTVADRHLISVSAHVVRRLFDHNEVMLREILASVTFR